MFGRLFRTDPMKKPAARVYESILASSRQPHLYETPGVPDTVDGRFDLLVIHASIFFRHMRKAGEAGLHMNQLVFDRMFDDMDVALREMGTGDPSVGKKIKQMGQAFYGRAQAYETALNECDATGLAQVIQRNLFASDGAVSDEVPDGAVEDAEQLAVSERLAAYMLSADEHMAAQDMSAILEGQLPTYPEMA